METAVREALQVKLHPKFLVWSRRFCPGHKEMLQRGLFSKQLLESNEHGESRVQRSAPSFTALRLEKERSLQSASWAVFAQPKLSKMPLPPWLAGETPRKLCGCSRQVVPAPCSLSKTPQPGYVEVLGSNIMVVTSPAICPGSGIINSALAQATGGTCDSSASYKSRQSFHLAQRLFIPHQPQLTFKVGAGG